MCRRGGGFILAGNGGVGRATTFATSRHKPVIASIEEAIKHDSLLTSTACQIIIGFQQFTRVCLLFRCL